jgi:hypothetical protein
MTPNDPTEALDNDDAGREYAKDDDDDYGRYEPDGYECMCCGHVQATAGLGGTCNKCAGPTTEWYG